MQIEVRTTPTLEDYLRFRRHVGIRSVTMWVQVFMNVGLLAFLLAFVLLPADAGSGGAGGTEAPPGKGSRLGAIACLSCFVILGVVVNPMLAAQRRRKRFAIDPRCHAPRTFRFSSDGVLLTIAEKDITIPWDRLLRAKLHAGLLMLFDSSDTAWIIPMRDVPAKLQPDLFKMIRQHVRRTRGMDEFRHE